MADLSGSKNQSLLLEEQGQAFKQELVVTREALGSMLSLLSSLSLSLLIYKNSIYSTCLREINETLFLAGHPVDVDTILSCPPS